MPASPIRKLVPYSDAAKKRGIKVYHLNIGQPDIKTPEIAIEAVKNYKEKLVINLKNIVISHSLKRSGGNFLGYPTISGVYSGGGRC